MTDSNVLQRKRLSDCVGGDLDLVALGNASDVWMTGVEIDSRKVRPGDLFVAIRGAMQDGHDFVDAAFARGAAGALVERDIGAVPGPAFKVVDTRRAAARIAARFYDHPSHSLGCIGVTGTNGKTSVAHFTATLLSACGVPAGFAGTLGWGFGGRTCPSSLTTDDAITLQRKLAGLLAAGAEWVAMEVSSHALEQGRVDEVAYDIAVFTNLTRDHLDYHGSMERYAQAKRRLFAWPTLQGGVLNWDDPVGQDIYRERRDAFDLLRFGVTAGADVSWSSLQFDDRGVAGSMSSPWGRRRFTLPLFGEFNVANFAAAAAAACLAGAAFDDVIEAGARLTAPSGRMEFVRAADGPIVVVDFAHTPDALTNALGALRRHIGGRLICVFGCGGDRDRGKRALMAQAVEAAADLAWVTSDNPRSEAPEAIAADVVAGFRGGIPFEVEVDRASAIERAIAEARVGDVVLIAGKGHEAYQEIGGRRIQFRDADVARRALGV